MRFGLFGTGYWAAETQAPALVAHPEATLVGVWGRDPAKAGAVASRYGARGYADIDALIADVDAIAVALPPDVQADIAERAADAGRHLLLDKPLALSVAGADRVVDAARRSRVASVIFYTSRFYGNVAAFLDEATRTGHWHGARVTMRASIFQPGSPYADSTWRRERGGLWDIGPHALAVVLPLLGRVTQVAAMSGPYATTHALLGHAGGATSVLELTLDAPPAATSTEFELFGDAGTTVVPDADGTPASAFAEAVSQLIAAAGRDEPAHPCDVRFSREVVGVLEAVETARLSGRTIDL